MNSSNRVVSAEILAVSTLLILVGLANSWLIAQPNVYSLAERPIIKHCKISPIWMCWCGVATPIFHYHYYEPVAYYRLIKRHFFCTNYCFLYHFFRRIALVGKVFSHQTDCVTFVKFKNILIINLRKQILLNFTKMV